MFELKDDNVSIAGGRHCIDYLCLLPFVTYFLVYALIFTFVLLSCYVKTNRAVLLKGKHLSSLPTDVNPVGVRVNAYNGGSCRIYPVEGTIAAVDDDSTHNSSRRGRKVFRVKWDASDWYAGENDPEHPGQMLTKEPIWFTFPSKSSKHWSLVSAEDVTQTKSKPNAKVY